MKTRMGIYFLLLSVLFSVSCGAISLAAAPTPTQAVAAYTATLALTSTSTSTSTFTPTLTPTLAPTPVLDTPTNTPTPTPSVTSFTLMKPAFCRKGPDVSWTDVTGILKGETVPILGVSEDGYWYFVFLPRYKVKCWVAAPTGQVSGDLTGVPVMVSPPTPTPTK